MKANIHFRIIAVLSLIFHIGIISAQEIGQMSNLIKSTSLHTDSSNNENHELIPQNFILPTGDTIVLYKPRPIPLNINTEKNLTGCYKDEIAPFVAKQIISSSSASQISIDKNVGKIPIAEGVSPSGARTYTIPITTVPVNGASPQISISYNSQSGNGIAGYGWNIGGVSCITVVNKTQYYDSMIAPIDLSKPYDCVFSLDGVRLVNNTDNLLEYQYETAQGFILVKKHIGTGGNISYFTVAYPNGSVATFGFKENNEMKLFYPITEIIDSKGYKISFKYIVSGNNYYVSKIEYGSKSNLTPTAQIDLLYADRNDFTTSFVGGLPLSVNKLLKRIVSSNNVNGTMQELYTYTLTHTENEVNRLTKIDCSSGSSSLQPINFTYGNDEHPTPAVFQKEFNFINNYFSENSGASPIYIRGKFIKGEFSDGLISFPGKFSPYTAIPFPGVKLYIYGSEFPADQDILVAPILSSEALRIKAEEGFQTIQAVDINGDGVDEIVKVNFEPLSKDIYTRLKITTYTLSNNKLIPQTFTVQIRGVVDTGLGFNNPMSRSYYWGDFKGTGKVQLLAVSHNKTLVGKEVGSNFALIDLDEKALLSDMALFPLEREDVQSLCPLDINGDGKMELCYATPSGLDVYSLMDNAFQKQYTTTSINKKQFGASSILGDINGDGKVDILVSPENSYTLNESKYLPIWAPRTCPYCMEDDPIEDSHHFDCKKCHKNIEDYYLQHPSYGRCCLCRERLEYKYSEGFMCENGHASFVIINIEKYIDKGKNWKAFLSSGYDFVQSEVPIINRENGDSFILMDVNQDGLADLLRSTGKHVDLFMNKRGNIQSVSTCSIPVTNSIHILPANICDLYRMSHFVNIIDGEVLSYSFQKNFVNENLLTSLTDSYGNTFRNEYNLLTDRVNNYYSSNASYTYPYYDWIGPLYTLSSCNGVSANYTQLSNQSYFYRDAVMHRQGLGFCGFTKIETRDNLSGRKTVEVHDPQLFGVTKQVDTPEKSVTYQYTIDNFQNKKNNPVPTHIEEKNILTNVLTATTINYDNFKQPVHITVNIGSNTLQSVTEKKYNNIITSNCYLIGQPVETSTTNIRDGMTWNTKEVIKYYPNNLPESRISYIQGNKVNEIKWEYDTYGNVTSEKSAPYNVTEFLGNTYTYDPTGQYVASSTNALGQTTTYSNYDKFGNACTVTDFKNRITTHTFDAWGKLIATQYPDGTKEEVKTDWGGQGLYTVTKTATGKPSTVVHYDALGREIRKGNQRFDGQWQFVDQKYDGRGRLEKVSLPFRGTSPNFWATYTYAPYNRPLTLTEASGKTTTWAYDGLSTTETRNGIATIKTTDESGALIKVEDPGGAIEYTLRPDGQPSRITAPGNVVTSFEYDQYGRQTSITDPSAGRQSFTETYAADGSKTLTVTDARNVSNTTVYDQYGRVVEKRADTNTSYVYNDDGTLAQLYSDNHSMRVFEYDEMGRVAAVWNNLSEGKFLEKRFNYHDGNIAEISYTSQTGAIATEKYVYSNGYNTEIKLNDDISIWKLTEENALGQPTKAVTGPLVRTYAYNEFGISTGRAAGNIQNFAYDFDVQTGNLNSRTDNIRHLTETFGYDNLNRLSSIGQQQITYAPNGNITQMPGMGSMQYNHADRPYQVTMLTPDGNTMPLRSQTIAYNSIQRPDEISENGIKASLTYNAGGDRIKMIVDSGGSTLLTRYYFDNKYEIDGVKANAAQRLYIGGDAYSAPAVYVKEENSSEWKIFYICRDYLGSITHVANVDGTLKQELSYDAWGRLRNPDTQVAYSPGTESALFLGRGYTGHEHLPQFGLINMNARLYDPVLGRFLSPDPYVQMPDFTQNFNRYSYCLNNPLVYIDASGEIVWFVPVIIGAVIGSYTGGVLANEGQYNPFKWDYSSSKTWRYMAGGAIVGGLAGWAGGAIAGSGIPLANTAAIAGSSLINSVGTWTYTGGQTPITMSFGIASYDFTHGTFGYLGKKGNKWYENIGYGFGALANLSDMVSLFSGGGQNIKVNSAKTTKEDWWGHSSVTDENGNSLVSVGPESPVGKSSSLSSTWKNSIKVAKTNWETYLGEKGTWSIELNNVSTTAISKYAAGITRWDLLLNSCVGHTTRALLAAGIPTIYAFHPSMLNIQLLIRQLGMYSSPYLYQIP